ncbi:hypothetical protein LINGRAHAP2_LOCUS12363 [Linum grandiflorum]
MAMCSGIELWMLLHSLQRHFRLLHIGDSQVPHLQRSFFSLIIMDCRSSMGMNERVCLFVYSIS